MRKSPPPEHRENFAHITELLAIRERESTKAALCQQIQACLSWQRSLKRWLSLSHTPNARWHGVCFADAEKLLAALEAERQDLSRALVALLGSKSRQLTEEEEALLDHYEEHEFPEPPPPAAPDLAEPGSPEKVKLLADRLDAGCGLWHSADAELAPTDRVAYKPRHAAGNFATVGRDLIFFLLITPPEKETP